MTAGHSSGVDFPHTSGPFFDPEDDGFLTAPHLIFDELRAHHSVVRDPVGWSTIDYSSSMEAFMNKALVPGIDPLLESRGIEPLWGEAGRTLTDSEGDDHRRLRRVVKPWFTARRIDELQGRVSDLCRDIVTTNNSDTFDLMKDLAQVVPAKLFCWMVGADEDQADELAALSKTLLSVFTATEEMVEPVRAAKSAMANFTRDLIRAKMSTPGDDLVSILLAGADAGDIDDADVFFLIEELLSASVDNTANTTALAMWTLLRHRDAWNAICENTDKIPTAVEECQRFEPAIRHTIKYAIADTHIGGVAITAGDFVTIRIAAAHRDPTIFDDPHRLDIDRQPPKSQLAFGAGRHFCLGAALGRMEINEMVRALATHRPDVQLGLDIQMNLNDAGIVHALPMNLGVLR